MPSDFKDLDEVLEITKKRLPIGGQVVEFPDRISAETGVMLLRLQQRGRENPALLEQPEELLDGVVDDGRIDEFYTELLGRPLEEFLPLVRMDFPRAMHVIQTLIAWHLAGEDTAREVWNNPGKAPGPTPARKKSKGSGKSARRGSRG